MQKIILSVVIAAASVSAFATPQVVTSIKPVQSLTAQVMDGVGEPALLIKQGSPHGYQMKPSDAKALNNADLLIYVSDDLETFLPSVISKSHIPHVIEWAELVSNPLLTRTGGMWQEDEHADHEHADHEHADHEHEDHEHADHEHADHEHADHEHEDHEHADHEHADHEHADHEHADHEHADHEHADHEHADHEHHGHHHGKYDAHLWLDTEQSKKLVQTIAAELAQIDPNNAAKYRANAEKAIARLDALKQQLDDKLAPVKQRPYMVFHDAYQYFEKAHNLNAIGTVRVDPEHEPGAKRIGELHQIMHNNDIVCVFSEPQFPAKIIDKLTQHTTVKRGVLDPVGADIPAGKDMYATLLTQIADNLVTCLAP